MNLPLSAPETIMTMLPPFADAAVMVFVTTVLIPPTAAIENGLAEMSLVVRLYGIPAELTPTLPMSVPGYVSLIASGLTLKLKTKSLTMLSGGSLASTSEIFVLSTVTVQLLPAGRPPVGVSTRVVRLFCGNAGVKFTVLPQLIVTPLNATLTFSLKLIVIVEFSATSVALSVGMVVVTDGA